MKKALRERVDKWLNELPYVSKMYLKDYDNGQYSMNYITTHEVVNYFKDELEIEQFLNQYDKNKKS